MKKLFFLFLSFLSVISLSQSTGYNLPDYPTGGLIGRADTTVDFLLNFNLNQTTPGQTLIIPPSLKPLQGRQITFRNRGTADVMLNPGGLCVAPTATRPGTGIILAWTGGPNWVVISNGSIGSYSIPKPVAGYFYKALTDSTVGWVSLPSTSETDPIWHSDSSLFLRKTTASVTYQSNLVSGTNIKTINGNSVLGSGNITTGTGTVTSVGVTSTDLSFSGSPITTSGTLTLNLAASGVTPGTYGSVTVDSKGRVTAGTRLTKYSGTTAGSGTYTVTYPSAYAQVPNVQPVIRNQSNVNQFALLTSSTTTGFTVTVYQRNVVTLLSVEVLLSSVATANGLTVDVIVTE